MARRRRQTAGLHCGYDAQKGEFTWSKASRSHQGRAARAAGRGVCGRLVGDHRGDGGREAGAETGPPAMPPDGGMGRMDF